MLNEVRKSQIAYAAMEEQIRRDGIPGLQSNSFQQEMNKRAKTWGVSPSEAKEFVLVIIAKVLTETFEKKVVIGDK